MVKKGKTLLILFLLVVLICGTCIPDVSAETKAPSRVISIAFDNSGSMNKNDKYAYASYSLQMFAGLLNDSDIMYVTYMDDNGKEIEVSMSSSGRQSEIDKLRKKTEEDLNNSFDTPFSSVVTAFKKLKNCKKADENTEFWLIIITDGTYKEFRKSDNKKAETSATIKKLAESNMPNGKKANIEYMAIVVDSDKAVCIDSDDSCNLTAYQAKSSTDIIKTFSDISESITGKYRLSSSEIKVEGSSLTVESEIPLKNIVAVVQQNSSKLKSVTDSSGKEYSISRNVNISTPGKSVDMKSVVGVCENGASIPPGKYTLNFSSSVANNVDILFEPAFEVRLEAYLNGDKLDDLSSVTQGDEINYKAVVVDPGTGEPIDNSILNKYGIDGHIEYYEDGKLLIEEDGDSISVVVGSDASEGHLSAVFKIGDFENVSGDETFKITHKPVIAVKFTGGTGDNKYVFTIPSKICRWLNKDIDNSGSVPFTVTIDGENMSADDIKADYSIDGVLSVNRETEITEGQVDIKPNYSPLDYLPKIFHGFYSDTTVKLTVGEASDSGEFTIDATNVIIDIIALILIILIIAAVIGYFLYCYLTRGKFEKCQYQTIIWAVKKDPESGQYQINGNKPKTVDTETTIGTFSGIVAKKWWKPKQERTRRIEDGIYLVAKGGCRKNSHIRYSGLYSTNDDPTSINDATAAVNRYNVQIVKAAKMGAVTTEEDEGNCTDIITEDGATYWCLSGYSLTAYKVQLVDI